MIAAAIVAVAALALVGLVAVLLAHDQADDRVSAHWRDAHHRARRDDDA